MFVCAVGCIAVSLLAGDAGDASALTVDVLAGKGRRDAGLIQTAVINTKHASGFLQHLNGNIMSASGDGSCVTADGY